MQMNRIFVLGFFVWGFIVLTGCNKLEIDKTNQSNQGVIFSIAPGANLGNLKSTDTINCINSSADYATAVIDDSTYHIDVFYIGGMPYTNSLFLLAGYHTLKEFTLWNDNNTPNNVTDDVMLSASPHAGSNYAPYVVSPLNIPFTIESFKKVELPVEVICYEMDHFTDFGFTYFQIHQVVVREETFFGDLCIKSTADYVGSLYAGQSGGLKLDMPAIFKIEVYRNGTLQQTFSNETWKGEGQPLKVTYGDYLNQVDHFEFKLYVLLRKDAAFYYTYLYSWAFDDDQIIPQGNDGIVDFTVGNCNPSSDILLPSWLNLPATCNYKFSSNYAPGSKGGYVDATLSGFSNVYDITTGTYASYGADHTTSIPFGQTLAMAVYSSLYQNLLPTGLKNTKWAKINWIMNHLTLYPGYKWYDVQGAIWLMDTPAWNGQAFMGVPALSTMHWAQQMYNDALINGVNYNVPAGGTAALILLPSNQSNMVQIVFVKTGS